MKDDKKMIARQKVLLGRLKDATVDEILGVVAPPGVSGGCFGDEKLWTLTFTFSAWRIVGSEIQKDPLSVRRKVSEKNLLHFQNKIDPYAVVRIQAKVAESVHGGYQALMKKFIGVDASDPELNYLSEQLQKPVTREDSTFGTLTLDRNLDWFSAKVVWDGVPVTLHLSESANVNNALKAARQLWQNQSEWNRRVRKYAVQELLPLKNENWLDEDEAELSSSEFIRRMTLESITVSPNGSFNFWHNDGGLFSGHSIQIGGSLSEGLTHADIPG